MTDNTDEQLNAFFDYLLAPRPPQPAGEDFFTVTVPMVNDGDPHWGTAITICGSWQSICGRFDLRKLPPGARIHQGKEARDFMRKSARDEARYQHEQRFKRAAGGKN